jgi:acyl-CoA hydrolase
MRTFVLRGSTSAGGLSIIALRSRRNGRSTIVPTVERTSTARSAVDVVVAEHGVADLRGLDDASRSRTLLAVCEPSLRDGSERAAAATV